MILEIPHIGSLTHLAAANLLVGADLSEASGPSATDL
jgi:hypothetical protein